MSANTHEFTYQVDSDENSDSTIDADTLEELKATLSGVQLNTNITAFSISITSESTPFKPREATVDDETTNEVQSEGTANCSDGQNNDEGTDEDGVHECDECEQTFDNRGTYANHVRWEHIGTYRTDNDQADEDDNSPSEDYLNRIDDDEDVDPKDVVDINLSTNGGKWYVMALLYRTQGRLKRGQILKLLEDTEWDITDRNVSESLRILKDNNLIDGEGKDWGNAYQLTQLGRDYFEAKNSTTDGNDIHTANQIVNQTDVDRPEAGA